MYYILLSVLFGVMALLALLNGMRKGKKYIWSYSVARLVVAIVSAVASAFLSAKLSFFFFRWSFTALKDGSGKFAELLSSVPLMTEALSALASMIVAPILFYFVFWILRHVLDLVAKIVLRAIAKSIAKKKGTLGAEAAVSEIDDDAGKKSKKKKKKKKHKDDGYFRVSGKKNPLGRLCGALCGLVVFLFTMIPAVGMLGILNDTVAWRFAGSTHPVLQTIVEFVDAGANNVGAKAVRAVGGDALYSMMTTYEVGGQKATLAKETNLLGTVGHALSDMTNKDVPRKEAAESVQKIDEAFKETTLIPAVLPDFLNQAKESWDAGEAYCGVKKPSFGKMDGLVLPVLNVLGNSTEETIYDDTSTLVDSMAYMTEKDVLTDVKEDPMSMFKKQDVTEQVMGDLLKNDHLAPLVGDLSEFGIDLFGDAMGTSMENIHLDSSKTTNDALEAKLLAATLAEMAEITEAVKKGGMKDVSALTSLGPLMDAMAQTETIGRKNTDQMMINLLTAERLMSVTKLTAEQSLEVAKEINEGAVTVGYTAMLNYLADTIRMKESVPANG